MKSSQPLRLAVLSICLVLCFSNYAASEAQQTPPPLDTPETNTQFFTSAIPSNDFTRHDPDHNWWWWHHHRPHTTTDPTMTTTVATLSTSSSSSPTSSFDSTSSATSTQAPCPSCSSSDCINGQPCSLQETGQACTTDQQCRSGYCRAGICNDDDDGLSAGQIAGITLGGIILLLFIAMGCYYQQRKRHDTRKDTRVDRYTHIVNPSEPAFVSSPVQRRMEAMHGVPQQQQQHFISITNQWDRAWYETRPTSSDNPFLDTHDRRLSIPPLVKHPPPCL
ncbi:hypothetical protein BC941DRAFT_421338 [Chlamydoabsidia padenii]|nr:hypothetical protein BC941DRAFT_421338 [Chlamydoabsidia padenii]